MKRLIDYLQQLDFEYAISYSGLRGEKFEDLKVKNKTAIQQIEKELETARFMQKSKLRNKIELLSSEINSYTSRVINKEGKLHQSAIPIHRFEKEEKEIEFVLKVLNSKFEEQVFAMCGPVFRDAIVFYSKENQINGILHICFGCLWMKNEEEEDLEVDHRIFQKLKKKLIEVGHQISKE